MKFKIDNQNIENENQIFSSMAENENTICRLIKIYEVLGKKDSKSVCNDIVENCISLIKDIQKEREDGNCKRLVHILNNPFFRCLLEAHDNISNHAYANSSISKKSRFALQVRMLGLTRSENDPMGITLGKHSDGCIYVKRVLKGTMLQKQELVNTGDIVKSIDGDVIPSDLDEAEKILSACGNNFTMQVISKSPPNKTKFQIFLRCNFDYEPREDSSFPKSERGLAFKRNDIIEVVDQTDIDWWQARHLSNGETYGLVPSLCYWQQKKISYSPMFYKDGVIPNDNLKKKIMYNASKNSVFDSLECHLYEEVTKMPPVERKLVILIGADGVGKRSLKNHFIKTYPNVYGAPRPDTTREPKEGEASGSNYNFIDREAMQHDIALGAYLESGEHNGHLYGTRIDAIRAVIKSGRTCIFDCNPSALKRLRNAEFMPYVVYVEPPPLKSLIATKRQKVDDLKKIFEESVRLKQIYQRYIDLTLCNDDFENTILSLLDNYNTTCRNSQWVPADWVY